MDGQYSGIARNNFFPELAWFCRDFVLSFIYYCFLFYFRSVGENAASPILFRYFKAFNVFLRRLKNNARSRAFWREPSNFKSTPIRANVGPSQSKQPPSHWPTTPGEWHSGFAGFAPLWYGGENPQRRPASNAPEKAFVYFSSFVHFMRYRRHRVAAADTSRERE